MIKIHFYVLVILVFAFSKCFEPNYGEGGFACLSGACPEGYVCVEEGNAGAIQKICRKTQPWFDARRDQPSSFSTDMRVETSMPKPDGTWDFGLVDQSKPNDLISTDYAIKDVINIKDNGYKEQSVKDTFTPDAGIIIPCDYSSTVATGISNQSSSQSFDFILDREATPHVLFINASDSSVSHAWGGNKWKVESAVKGPIDQVSAALETKDLREILHLIYQKNEKIYHTYRTITSSTTWITPVSMYSDLTVKYLNAAADQTNFYAIAAGEDPNSEEITPSLIVWRISSGTNGYKYEPIYREQDYKYTTAQIGVGTKFWGATTYAPEKPAWLMLMGTHTSSSASLNLVANSGTISPASIAIDNKNGTWHYAIVRTSGTNLLGTLSHVVWDGSSTSNMREDVVVNENIVIPGSTDIAIDSSGRPFISYASSKIVLEPQPSTKFQVHYAYKNETKWLSQTVFNGNSTFSRIKVMSVDSKTYVHVGAHLNPLGTSDLAYSCINHH